VCGGGGGGRRVWLIGWGCSVGVLCVVGRGLRGDDGLRRRWRIRRWGCGRYDRLDPRLFVFGTARVNSERGAWGTSMCCMIHCRQAICQHPTVTASITIGSAAQIGHSPPLSPSICPSTSRPYRETTSSSSAPPSRNRANKSSSETSSPNSSCVAETPGSAVGSRYLTREQWQQDWRRRRSMERIVV
jgi:hypothetical protein